MLRSLHMLVLALATTLGIASSATATTSETALRANRDFPAHRVTDFGEQAREAHQQSALGYGGDASDSSLASRGEKTRNIEVRHSTRKDAIEAARHAHGGKPRPTPAKTDPASKRNAFKDAQKYKDPEAHPGSKHPESHVHDSNKSETIERHKLNRHHTFPE